MQKLRFLTDKNHADVSSYYTAQQARERTLKIQRLTIEKFVDTLATTVATRKFTKVESISK